MGVGPFPLFLLVSDLFCRLCECSRTYSILYSQFLYVGQIRLLIIAFYVTDFSFSSCDILCKLKWKITFWCIFMIRISFMIFHHVSLNAFLHGIHHVFIWFWIWLIKAFFRCNIKIFSLIFYIDFQCISAYIVQIFI